MKKILILFTTILISVSAFAQNTLWFQATAFAYKPNYSSTWSDWESSNVKISIDQYNEVITIYSQQTQIYKVVQRLPSPYDSSGIQEKYKVIAANGYYYYIRLRIDNEGNSQLYVDANDVSLVYNVTRIQ